MEGYDESAYYSLHPGLRLRNDIDRVVLITRPAPLTYRSYICYMLPSAEAVLLSLMNGRRTLGEVISLWADLTSKNRLKAKTELDALVKFYTTGQRAADKILIVSDQPSRHATESNPTDFVIPNSRLNLTERRLRVPINVYFITTLYCPQNCIYCYARTEKQHEDDLIPLERIKEILQELAFIGVEAIQFSGGDALARPGIFEIISEIYRLGMVADIPTKIGLGPEKARRLREMGVTTVQFSLDCVDPETLDFMVGVDQYHRRAFRALKSLKEAGLGVRINTVLTPYNTANTAELIQYAGDLGNVVRLSFSPYGRSSFRHRDELFVSEHHLQYVENCVAELAPKYGHMKITVGGAGMPPSADPDRRRREWKRRAFCTGNRDTFVILPDGRVTVCEELYDHPAFIIGDLRHQSVLEMWSSERARGLLYPDQPATTDGPCATCADFRECNAVRGRCWRDIIKSYGWNKDYYPDPRCPQAPPGNRLG